ncbi:MULTISPECIES: energy-coupling factor transporter ATPase [Tepidanaerobacter]|uniref:Energy-coupling factor transporter ATP-binding protein EcfA2 n=1 Tax=Tepidanaerobacter syntrophicus TaxID=224999 RepID=A0A0U9HNT6_9FIRM|nr:MULTISPECIES: energy-coupling factor transporter ATPase [Tepidanaerobacter]GAQ24663.1 energy-coupling factor transport system ATP-binding protein [Tepidanaerobacter syntrophicus]GLI19067.1 energy-coupling factor transporter ATP-binding protein EcfA [Tepidanaerobacter syntrophicus]GLI51058.1 energy-coupling factor transporter ATP-binding protein EcfA [Tepidanaerobacter syntrophicus]HHV83422.1 energy-coupling factor transporter ATPase [Tepidanaerobacter syntrophicus]
MSIDVKNLTHIYMPNTPFESAAIQDINWSVKDGEFWGLIGHTGSGKSTLIQHLNGLLKPTSGQVLVDGVNIYDKGVSLKSIRQKIGLVFQYPEHQLFEETVERDVAFGPKNMGLREDEISTRVKEALELVGLSYKEIKDKSPFELSGGQMRRVAIAGVLAMKPETLILDEPTAGLDPKGRDEILEEIVRLRDKEKITVILVSHSMEDVAKLVDKLAVMYRGRIVSQGPPREIFQDYKGLVEIGLGIPQITELMIKLKENGKDVATDILTVDEARAEIIKKVRRKGLA